jgi:hypothetical protein
VRDEEGRPLRKAGVVVKNEAGGYVFHSDGVELDEQGRADLPGLPPGSVTITVSTTDPFFSTEGYGLPAEVPAEVRRNETTPAEAVVRTGGRVRVVVRNRAGDVVAAERLDLLDLDGKRRPVRFFLLKEDSATTDLSEPGPCLLATPFPPGRYLVKLTRKGADSVTKEVSIVRGETTDLEFEVE